MGSTIFLEPIVALYAIDAQFWKNAKVLCSLLHYMPCNTLPSNRLLNICRKYIATRLLAHGPQKDYLIAASTCRRINFFFIFN